MEILLNTNGGTTVLNRMFNEFDDAKEILIAVAFLKSSGLDLIYSKLERAILKGVKVYIIVGTDFSITEPMAIKRILDLFKENKNARAYFAKSSNNSSSFHPKVYCFVKGDHAVVITGSSNLTSGGLKTNTELCIYETMKTNEQTFMSLKSFFNSIMSSKYAKLVTRKTLAGYETKYKMEKDRRNTANSEELNYQQTWNEIKNDFVFHLHQAGDQNKFKSEYWKHDKLRKKNSILKIEGAIDCLCYLKVSSNDFGPKSRWGATKNVIDLLNQSNSKWLLIFLFQSFNNGYIITDQDVNKYISDYTWPLANDGDYKIRTTISSQASGSFNSFSDFIDLLLGKRI